MRSYVKAYQKGTVFYATLELAGGDADAVWAILRPHKGDFLAMLNYGYNNFALPSDPDHGVPLASLYPGGFIRFEDYTLHPPD